jgi:hypothetical protein
VSPSPHLNTETDPVSETLCFLVFRIPDDGQTAEDWQFQILNVFFGGGIIYTSVLETKRNIQRPQIRFTETVRVFQGEPCLFTAKLQIEGTDQWYELARRSGSVATVSAQCCHLFATEI